MGNSSAQGEGGGGAGVRATVVGVVEIGDQQTRFLPINGRQSSPEPSPPKSA